MRQIPARSEILGPERRVSPKATTCQYDPSSSSDPLHFSVSHYIHTDNILSFFILHKLERRCIPPNLNTVFRRCFDVPLDQLLATISKHGDHASPENELTFNLLSLSIEAQNKIATIIRQSTESQLDFL